MPYGQMQQVRDIQNLIAHAQEIDHHHHEDLFLHVDDSSDSSFHHHSDGTLQPNGLPAFVQWPALTSVSEGPPIAKPSEWRNAVPKGLLRPPQSQA